MVDRYCPDSGDFIWIDFDPQVGREQAGHRPAVVLSSRSFNSRTSLAFVCPITCKLKGYPFEVTLPSHLPVHGVVLCEHMRSMDWQARHVTFIARAPDEVLLEVRETIAAIAGVNFE